MEHLVVAGHSWPKSPCLRDLERRGRLGLPLVSGGRSTAAFATLLVVASRR
jgi:hypothetical protein